MFVVAAQMFREQVTTDFFLNDVSYGLATGAVMLAFAGLFLIDLGAVRGKNWVDTATSKLIAGVIGALAWLFVGYAIWNFQVYQAAGVPDALWQSIKDWNIAGPNMTTLAQFADPAVAPGLDNAQVYNMFFAAFGFFMGGIVHSIGLERMKPLPTYVLSFISGGVMLPILVYLLWGNSGWLTNHGIHDLVGALAIYVPLGTMAVVLAWRLGPRLGTFAPHPRVPDPPAPSNLALVVVGIIVVMVAVPLFVPGGGYIIPGVGYFGISMTDSSYGILLSNVFYAYVGGGVVGAIISYRTHNPYWAVGGPFAGYISGATILDTVLPWQMALIAAGAPLVGLGVYHLQLRLKLDEGKIICLVLGPAVYGAIVGGFTEWGTKLGGVLGVTEGKYALQHAEVTPWWQLIALAIGVGTALIVTLAFCFVFERLGGLRVTEEQEIAGLDATYWTPEPHVSHDAPPPSRDRAAAAGVTSTAMTSDGPGA